MGISAVFPAVYAALYPWVPETPRWLTMVNRAEEARATQQWLTGSEEEEAEEQVAKITESLHGQGQVGWMDLFDKSVISRGLLSVALFMGLGQQLTGTEAILYYVPSIIDECPESGSGSEGCVSGSSTFAINMGVGTCKLVGELIAAATVEHVGRRKALTVSNLVLSVLVFTIALKFLLDWPTLAGAVSLCLVMFSFSMGPGPLTFVVVNEIVPLRLRGKVVALSLFFNRMGSGTIALTFLSLQDAVGAFAAFGLYTVLGLGVTIFYCVCVPELTGQSLEAGGEQEGSCEATI